MTGGTGPVSQTNGITAVTEEMLVIFAQSFSLVGVSVIGSEAADLSTLNAEMVVFLSCPLNGEES